MIAIPLHQSRVAPVLDWCSTIVLIPKNVCKSWQEAERLSVKSNVFDLLRLLHSRAVSPVICGAVSPHALCYGQHLGLEFICGISGAIDEVVEAYQAGSLDQPRFRLPGCRCPMRLRPLAGTPPGRPGAAPGTGVVPENQGKGRVTNHRGGQGRGHGCAVRGTEHPRGVAVCFCPQCGRAVPHRRGVPCNQAVCEVCGTPLVRKPPALTPSL